MENMTIYDACRSVPETAKKGDHGGTAERQDRHKSDVAY